MKIKTPSEPTSPQEQESKVGAGGGNNAFDLLGNCVFIFQICGMYVVVSADVFFSLWVFRYFCMCTRVR